MAWLLTDAQVTVEPLRRFPVAVVDTGNVPMRGLLLYSVVYVLLSVLGRVCQFRLQQVVVAGLPIQSFFWLFWHIPLATAASQRLPPP